MTLISHSKRVILSEVYRSWVKVIGVFGLSETLRAFYKGLLISYSLLVAKKPLLGLGAILGSLH